MSDGEKLRSMNMHEVINLKDGTRIMRVVGGWIYTYHHFDSGQMNSVFVPFA